ncbi:hypothetical protein GCM10022227_26840 [Streptomyces sedi]
MVTVFLWAADRLRPGVRRDGAAGRAESRAAGTVAGTAVPGRRNRAAPRARRAGARYGEQMALDIRPRSTWRRLTKAIPARNMTAALHAATRPSTIVRDSDMGVSLCGRVGGDGGAGGGAVSGQAAAPGCGTPGAAGGGAAVDQQRSRRSTRSR